MGSNVGQGFLFFTTSLPHPLGHERNRVSIHKFPASLHEFVGVTGNVVASATSDLINQFWVALKYHF